jgi:hypothetical protein
VSLTKTSKAYGNIEDNLQGILEGVMVSIDPSIGSSSSMPGWAVYRTGQYVASGTFDIPIHRSLPDRLRTLANHIRKLYNEYSPDVLAYEDIPAQRYGMGNAIAHASLLKALGAILSVPGPDGYVGIMPVSWKKMVRDTYTKGDEADAVEIGYVVIECAGQIRYNKENIKGGKGHGRNKEKTRE